MEPKIKIIIEVGGGLVQNVYAKSVDLENLLRVLDVEVYDLDGGNTPEEISEIHEKERELEKISKSKEWSCVW